MTLINVKREDITVEEDFAEVSFTALPQRYWLASLDGDNSAGFRTRMFRSGKTYDEALGNLTGALEEMGWAIE